MFFRNIILAIVATAFACSSAFAQDFGHCTARIAELQSGRTAIATFHEVWFAPNRDWLRDEYPAAMVVSHEFGIEAVSRGPAKEFAMYESAWTSSQLGWYVVAEPSAVGVNSEHAFLPLYLFSDAEECLEIQADWWVEIDDLPPEMKTMLE